MMTHEHLSTSSPDWPPMWEALAEACGDYADCCPETGECWQYMGTYNGTHQFRHRHRPQFINGHAIQPIKGFAGQHWDRVYLDINAETLRVTRLRVVPYINDHSAQWLSREIIKPRGDSPQQTSLRRSQSNEDYSGVFDGFNVTSDADPGL